MLPSIGIPLAIPADPSGRTPELGEEDHLLVRVLGFGCAALLRHEQIILFLDILPFHVGQRRIYISPALRPGVKFLYCPKCKELRVKSWYSIRDRCPRCFGDATPIKIPFTIYTLALYTFYVLVPVLVGLYVTTDIETYLYFSIATMVIMFAIAWIVIGQGEDYAWSKIKVTNSDVDRLGKRMGR